ncbi:TIGR02217 family protein [Paracoccus sp. (in: a-proteobacteria)]|uniref:phage distal tail protein, Rcc01695 family n=1 Tax=Paracoccus sp. TaxID=267 RepID=UPI003A898440
MAFHEVRFPANLSFGSVGGPERRTEIVTLASGFEERNTPWAHARRRYDAGMGLRSLDDLEALVAFFEARAGQLHGFRWKDWSDYKSGRPSRGVQFDDQLIAVGDGETTEFALKKAYVSGPARYERLIVKPVRDTVRAGVGGVERFPGGDYSVDHATGLVTFASPPEAGAEVTAGFEFDVPVRFDTDRIAVSVASFQAGEMPEIPVLEVRL